ncbi:MFS general substrate transporter [Meredithblackwellia eburnea MCA 4105]
MVMRVLGDEEQDQLELETPSQTQTLVAATDNNSTQLVMSESKPAPSQLTTKHYQNSQETDEKLVKSSSIPQLPPGLILTQVPNSNLLILNFSQIPASPDDPLLFSRAWKSWITLVSSLLVMNTALASSTPTGSAPFIQAQFGGNSALILSTFLLGYVAGPFMSAPLSEAFGRRPISIWGTTIYTIFSGACIASKDMKMLLVLRFFSGLFGAVPMTNSGAVCGDVWSAKERGTAMAFYSVATFAGPALGPVIGSFTASRLNWRYTFVVLTAYSAFLCILTIFACPETYPPIIVTKLARKLRKETGDERIVSRIEFEERASRGTPKLERFKAETKRIVGTPLIMITSEPIVIFITAFMSFVYGLIYLLFEAYPVIFDDIHQLGAGYSSLPFLTTLIGAVVSVPITLWYQRNFVAEVKANGGKHTPEMRLPAAQVGGVIMTLSFFYLGWTGYKRSIHWIFPTLSGIPSGVASVLIFRSLQTFLLDAYERYGASALAANVIVRSIAGATFPLFGRVVMVKLGVNWACTMLAGLMLLLVPIPFLFERYGARIRARSRFAAGR